MIKSLKELAWNVSEAEYRADPGISYSTLSRFKREGWRNISHLYDKLDTPALTFGSAVDTLITDSLEAFDEQFICCNFPNVSDSIALIIKELFNLYGADWHSLEDISNREILEIIVKNNYQPRWQDATRVKKIIEEGSGYYVALDVANGKRVLTQYDKNDSFECVRVLRTSPITAEYFTPSDDKNIEILYQLKFKATYQGIPVRCMFDVLKVDHLNKIIYPKDLKTTGHPEEEFEDSIVKWNYYIQAQLYTYILQQVIAQDEYFKDFKIADWDFIVINRRCLSPMIWEFPYNFAEVDSIDSAGTIHPNWRKLLLDLNWYLQHPNTKYSIKAIENHGVMCVTNLKPV